MKVGRSSERGEQVGRLQAGANAAARPEPLAGQNEGEQWRARSVVVLQSGCAQFHCLPIKKCTEWRGRRSRRRGKQNRFLSGWPTGCRPRDKVHKTRQSQANLRAPIELNRSLTSPSFALGRSVSVGVIIQTGVLSHTCVSV